MPSETNDRTPARPQNPISSQPLPKITEALPCPRCDSTSTKFCYYNNYNLSQPRHFCKACRRYWTQGGTLRNVPVGGGTRKNSKRTRTSSSSSSSSATSSSSSSTVSTHETTLPVPTNPDPVLSSLNPKMVPVSTNGVNLSETGTGNFTAMLNMQGQNFLGLGGFPGYGIGSGFEELDLGFGGTRVWDVPGASFGINGHNSVGGGIVGGVGNGGSGGAAVGAGCNTWQMMSGDDHDQGGNGTTGGLVGDQDCFAWSGLAISTPGKGLK